MNNDLLQAMQMFSQGIKEYSFQKALMDANTAVKQIKESELKDHEKNSQLQQISNQLVTYMAGQGLPATTIQQVSAVLGPQRPQSLVEAIKMGDQSTVNAYKEADRIQRTGEIEQLKTKAEIDAAAQERLFSQQDKLNALKMSNEKPTGDQYKAGIFGKRAYEAEETFDALVKSGYDRASISSSLNSLLPNRAQSAKLQKQTQAERNFVNAVLRRESGAAISQSEFENAEKQYFPRSGDSEEVLKQKRQNRMTVIQGLLTESGPAATKLFPRGLPQKLQMSLGGSKPASGNPYLEE